MEEKRMPLYYKIKQYLYCVIGEHAHTPNFRMPSEYALAKSFNVSRITTKRALQELAAEGLVVRRPGYGTFIAPGIDEQTRGKLRGHLFPTPSEPAPARVTGLRIALIIPDLKSKYFLNVIKGLYQCFADRDAELVLAISQYSQLEESRLIQKMIGTVDGLIIHPVNNNSHNKDIIRLSLHRFPLVLIDNIITGIDSTVISSDNYRAGYRAAEYLLSRGKRHIAVVCQPHENILALYHRIKGYKKALTDTGIAIDNGLILKDLDHYDENANQKLREFFQGNPRIDSVIALNYETGIKVITYLQSADCGLTSRDVILFDEEFADIYHLLNCPINYIYQDAWQIGFQAGTCIFRQLADKNYMHHIQEIPAVLYVENKPLPN